MEHPTLCVTPCDCVLCSQMTFRDLQHKPETVLNAALASSTILRAETIMKFLTGPMVDSDKFSSSKLYCKLEMSARCELGICSNGDSANMHDSDQRQHNKSGQLLGVMNSSHSMSHCMNLAGVLRLINRISYTTFLFASPTVNYQKTSCILLQCESLTSQSNV